MKPKTLEDFGGDFRPSGEQLNYRHCPVCGSDSWKLYVNPSTGAWFCHAGEHGAGGKVEVGADLHASRESAILLNMLDGPRRTEVVEVDMPPFGALSRSARRYLHRRGLDDEEIARLGIVEWEDEYRVLIPYFDGQGQLIYWNSRRYSDNLGDGPKYKAAPGKHPLYLPERRHTDVVVLVEGVFDALAVNRHTPHQAIALGGKFLPQYLRKPLRDEISSAILSLEGVVVVALDGDATGDSLSLVNKMPAVPRTSVRLVQFDQGEDPASVSPARLQEVLNVRTQD